MGRMRLWASSFGLWLAAPGVSIHLIQPANFYRGMVSPALGVLCGQAKWGPLTVEPSIRHFIISFPRHCFVMIRYPPVPEAKTRIEFSGMRSSAFILEVKEQEQE
ncbi:uncharacterized protein BO88DRAFT_411304 [Aspergillus vadensis CBS 113365]|uniref:Secreted protein n=1 Tax=Aspergillus vadensis (strain CBS 113365 / IMI 142717 / IBT 24658) TaxID=1448311 RepID=A0A319BMP4_ASPVC|nr:hypothetical protein BO88DRAFT_411304 [Aspergillus vadensis CBS 113365]PYH73927.1 hypothetical protein BO88DRAFT_411304 [Aspergillus vadensis CBS 113365]